MQKSSPAKNQTTTEQPAVPKTEGEKRYKFQYDEIDGELQKIECGYTVHLHDIVDKDGLGEVIKLCNKKMITINIPGQGEKRCNPENAIFCSREKPENPVQEMYHTEFKYKKTEHAEKLRAKGTPIKSEAKTPEAEKPKTKAEDEDADEETWKKIEALNVCGFMATVVFHSQSKSPQTAPNILACLKTAREEWTEKNSEEFPLKSFLTYLLDASDCWNKFDILETIAQDFVQEYNSPDL
jgi:hypothetical protein